MKSRRSDSRPHRGRRLDVALAHDERSLAYPMRAALDGVGTAPLRSRRWPCEFRLDQGREGACVGFGGAHFFGAEPMPQFVSEYTAKSLYKGAQDNDEWPGNSYEGTSVTGLMRYAKAEKVVAEYRWIFTAEELYITLALYGPVIIGCEWREGCFDPDQDGTIHFTGIPRGGHCVCIDEVDFERRRIGILQSWGRSHGIDGRVYLSFDDVELLFRTRPQCVYPSERQLHIQQPKRRWWQFWK